MCVGGGVGVGERLESPVETHSMYVCGVYFFFGMCCCCSCTVFFFFFFFFGGGVNC